MSELPSVVQQTYTGATQDESSRLFAADAGNAIASGYRVLSQEWHGSSLAVTYELGAVAGAAAVAAAGPATLSLPQGGAGLSRAVWTPPSIAVIAGGALLALGAFLPWETATGFGVTQSASGVSGLPGFITLFLGGGLIASGVGIAMAWRPRVWRVAAVLAVIAVLYMLLEIGVTGQQLKAETDAANGIGSGLGTDLGALGDTLSVKASVGFGLLIALVGGIVATVGAFLAGGLRAWISKRRTARPIGS